MRSHGPKRVKKLAGTRALVTGGTVRGGRSRWRSPAKAPTSRSATCSRHPRRRGRCARSKLGVRAIALRADLAKPAEARRLVGRAARALGGLDLLVNNAAIFVRTRFMATTPAQFDHLIAVNLRGAFFCAQAAAGAMGRRGGRIVNIADMGAVRAWPGYIPYTSRRRAWRC